MGNCRSKKKQILVFLGSNSSNSIHKALLKYMMSFEVFYQNSFQLIVPNLAEIPFFNPDILKIYGQSNSFSGISKQIQQLLKLVSRAKAIIFITPQYNGAVSPSILNACEWITEISKRKTAKHNPFHHKPIGIMSCSYISQNQIKDIEMMLKHNKVRLINQPFYVDLKTGQIDVENLEFSQKLKTRLHEWVDRFLKFL